MLRSIDAPRGPRRALGVVCALLVITGIGLSQRQARTAAAEPAAASPARVLAPRVPPAPPAPPAALPAPPPRLPASTELLLTSSGGRVLAYPPRALPAGGGPAPVAMMLHGMCSDVQATCDRWSEEGRAGRWLVCPAGNARCGAYDDWKGSGAEKAAALDAALDAVDRAFGPALVTHAGGDVLVGFSRGAFVARDVAYARPGRYRALVLLGAALSPDPDRLAASGIRRVVLGCGDFDPARRTMEKAARDLAARGIATRWVSLGPVGHALPKDVTARLSAHVAWAAGA
jgi:pimeloyl-ACP methyl ester carboxylesterase